MRSRTAQSCEVSIKSIALTFVLVAFCLSPLTLFAQRLSITPPDVTVMEGESADFTVVLSSEPTANVTVTITGGDKLSLGKAVLIFTPLDWNVGQIVTLKAAEDEDDTDDSATLILIASGGGYDGDGVIVEPNAARILSLGESTQLNATVHDQDESPVTGVAFDWSSADPSVAVVDSTGKVTAVNFGMTTITAALATVSGTAEIQVGNTPDPNPDREILEILYNATGGEGWHIREGWLTDAPLNDWNGVTTNTEGRVTGLGLIENNLSGPIPPELGSLTRLEGMFLNNNSLTGPIPPELGNLKQLEALSLSKNNLTGPIPPELGNLTQLRLLRLPWNELTGPIPSELGSLTRLEEMFLNNNSLTSPIPPELGNLTQLRRLRLLFNDLTGPIPSELGSLTLLEEMRLRSNSLTGPVPPELGNLTRLERLELGTNSLTGLIPPELGNLTQLRHLSLIWNELTGAIPPELGSLTRLEEMRLYNNYLTGSIPPEFGNLTQLKTLHLAANSLTAIPPELGTLTQLRHLSLMWNELTGPIPPELGNLKQLETLSLFRNSLTGPIPPELGSLTQLEVANLQKNSLTGPIPPELGNLTQLKDLDLDENSLTGPIPRTIGNLTQLKELDLSKNSLTGPIPPELGNLEQLVSLYLNDNSLTGSIPPEFANLGKLSELWLSGNRDMEGLLPRSLLNLSLSSIVVSDTGICNHQDAVFLEWWNSRSYSLADDCTPGEIERLALIGVHDKTNGASWANASGWGSDIPIGRWHGVTVENGRVTELSLPNNVLSGLIPGDVANFTELSVLNLADNSLTGALPKEISSLSNLTELRVNDNTGLEGFLGDDLMNLEKLEVLHFGGTSLCAPPTRRFQTWYEGIGNVRGALCGNPAEVRMDIPAAYLVQSVQTPQNTVRLIEGRDALLRVFVTGDQTAFFEHAVVATVHGGGRTHRVEMTRAGDRLAVEVNESDLANSFNAVIPGDVITPGATLVVEADPDGVIPRAVGSQDRFPATGEAPLQVVSVPEMEVTVVPVLEADQPDRSIFEWTDNIGDDSPEVGLFKYSFPFHEFRASSRSEYITSLDLTSRAERWGLVLELEALRLLDHASGYYYGAAASVNGFVRGLARLGGWTSMGKAWDTELAHEVGHNLNLEHAPCGGALGTDPDFPHSGGSIGAWGYDFRDSTLVSPEYHRDIMGYCYEQGWLSDYFFEKVIDYRERREGTSGPAMAGAPGEPFGVLVLWGGVQGGELRMEPPFPATAPAQLPEADGPYRLDGLGQNTVLFSLSFTPGEDKFGDKYFFFAVPIEQDWEESLDRIVLTGPEGSLTVSADDPRALSVVRDANTGQVRAILRDWDGVLPAALESAEDLEILTTQSLSAAVRLQR